MAPLLAADAPDDPVRAMQKQIEALGAQMKALQDQMTELKEQRLADAVDKKAKEESDKIRLSLEWKDGFKIYSADKRFQFQLAGRLMVDHAERLDGDDPLTNSFFIRRARIAAKVTMHKYYYGIVQVDFASGVGSLQDAYIELSHAKPGALFRAGQFKAPLGLEENTSSKYVKLIERSMVSNWIPEGRDGGVMLHGSLAEKRLKYWVSYMNGVGTNGRDRDDHKDVTARIVLQPFAPSDNAAIKGLQVGVAGSYGVQEGSISGAGPRTASRLRFWRYVSGAMADGPRQRLGLEAAWHIGPFGVSGEYMVMREETQLPGVSNDTLESSGWYATASWLVTGEKVGFKRVHPDAPLEPGQENSGIGAIELVGRLGGLRYHGRQAYLRDGSARRAIQLMVGVNWFPTSMTRFSINWQRAWFSDQVGGGGHHGARDDHEDSLLVRLQLEF